MPDEKVDSLDLLDLYRQHAREVRALAQRLLGPSGDVDDLVHDVFLVAWRKRGGIAAGSARSFLYGTTVKLGSNLRRRAKLRRLLGLQLPREDADWRTPERAAEHADARRVLYEILERMPEKRRTVFILHELQGMTGEEIAEALGRPANTIWARMRQARQEYEALSRAYWERLNAPKNEGGEGTP